MYDLEIGVLKVINLKEFYEIWFFAIKFLGNLERLWGVIILKNFMKLWFKKKILWIYEKNHF